MEAKGIERAQPQSPIRIIFRKCGITARAVDVRAEIEGGGAGTVERKRPIDRARRCRKIRTETPELATREVAELPLFGRNWGKADIRSGRWELALVPLGTFIVPLPLSDLFLSGIYCSQ